MVNIKAIIKALDEYLIKEGKASIGPPEANEYLEKIGLLNDSSTRPGLPLRRLLRNGDLPHANQPGGKGTEWIIPKYYI